MTEQKAYIVGVGEVGRRLGGALEAAGWTVRPVTRTEGWDDALDESDAAARILCMREDDVGEALERFPVPLRRRLVLVQNGFLEAVLGNLDDVGRGLVWFRSKGEFFEPLAPSLFFGGDASAAVGTAVDAGGIPAEVLPNGEAFLRAMVVKGVWNCVVGLPLAVREVTLDDYLQHHRAELEQLVAESVRAASAAYGVDVSTEATLATLEETTRPMRDVRGGTKSLAWRNGAVASFGRRHGVATPVNDALLRTAGYEMD